jgi:hypothetical protein
MWNSYVQCTVYTVYTHLYRYNRTSPQQLHKTHITDEPFKAKPLLQEFLQRHNLKTLNINQI